MEKLDTEHVISFILVDNNRIHEINRDFRNIDRPTDVISFATIDSSSDRTLSYELGDIYISIDKVKEQAKDIVQLAATQEAVKDEERLDEAIVYVNIHNYPPRAKCATLSWRALDALLHGEEGEQDEE